MTVRKYSSRSQKTSLSAAVTSSGTTITVVSAASLLGGVTLAANEVFTVVLDPDTALEEIVDIVSTSGNPVSGNNLTIVRGRDGSSGTAHSAGAEVRHMAIGRDYREANEHSEGSSGVHGVTGSVVGTTDTQTLTNKTLTSPKINENVALTATATELNVLDGITASTAELNILDGVTSTAAELNILDGVTSTAAELNILDGATLTVTELNYVDGVTSAIQTQLDGKQPVISGVSNTEIGYLDGVTSAIQTQIDAKAPTASPTFTGTVTLPDSTVTSAMIANGAIVDADVNASAAIAKTKLNLGGTITSADLVDGTIVASDIADGTITAAKMVSDPYARANHTGSQAASTISDLASTVKAYTLDEFADPAAAISMNSQKITTLATPTDNADAATKLYVDTKVADLVNSAPSTLDTLGEIASAIQSGGTVYESFVLKAGSTMTGALTLSGAPTSNLHAATKAYVDTVAGSTAAAEAAAAAAAASYDSFDDRYLGAKSTAPSVDNDGNALIEGALYWNSVDNAMYSWTGSEWGSISSTAEIYRFRFTASGGETTISGLDDNGLTLSYLPGKEQVYLNGVLLIRTTDYTASSGSSLTSLAALASGDVLEVITFTSFEVADAIARTVFDAKGDILVGTAADTVGKLPVGTTGQFLKADSTTATGLAWGEVAGALAQPSEPSSPSDGQIWIDTDGTANVATQQLRWTKAPSAGTTSLTGPDDNALTLTYTAGYEQVYLNGILISRGSDYTATDGATVTLSAATVAGDIVEIFSNNSIGITDVYTQSQADAKYITKTLTSTTGDIIYASAANTPARLGIGTSGQVLSVNGGGIPSWTTPASGGMTLISTTALSGTSVVLSSIPQTYNSLFLIVQGTSSTGSHTYVQWNGSNTLSTANSLKDDGTAMSNADGKLECRVAVSDVNLFATMHDYASTTVRKMGSALSMGDISGGYSMATAGIGYLSTTAITSISLSRVTGSFTGGTIKLYGVK